MKNKITRKIYYKLWTKKAKRINISVLLLQQINVKNRKLIATLIIKREGLLPIQGQEEKFINLQLKKIYKFRI